MIMRRKRLERWHEDRMAEGECCAFSEGQACCVDALVGDCGPRFAYRDARRWLRQAWWWRTDWARRWIGGRAVTLARRCGYGGPFGLACRDIKTGEFVQFGDVLTHGRNAVFDPPTTTSFGGVR